MALTTEAQKLLAATIRGTTQDPAKGLRHRLLEAIKSEAAGRYRLAIPITEAKLDEAHRRRRERLDAYLDEKTRATKPRSVSEADKTRDRLLRAAEQEAAATLVNRLVTLRLLEARGLVRSPLVTGGWNSKGYREFRDFAPGLVDDEAGYAFVLQLVFDDLATDLPGLFGDVGVTRLFPIPAKALRDAVEAFEKPELSTAWTDDTTLGWVYQYWNDPDREALDAKIGLGGKTLPHEIASKTQMFTERYMVEWLLQNSIGSIWLCICKKHGWTADADRVLPNLAGRRDEWRERANIGEIALDTPMPIGSALEEDWKYYVPRELSEDLVASAPDSVKALKVLDPACGSGHFLVIAFDLLVSLYREEARHRQTIVTDAEIARSIIENNLHGIDIDQRAVQIAAASLFVKYRAFAGEARPRRMNLVVPSFQIGNLQRDDPAVVQLRDELKRDAGISADLTNKLVSSLAGVDYLGSLFKVDVAVEEALNTAELEFEQSQGQGNLFVGFPAQQVKLSIVDAKATVVERLERFLSRHSTAEDLGLRLDGEQLAAGVRFIRLVRSGTYDVVVGNPPYHTTSKLALSKPFVDLYPEARADLFAAFYARALELTRPGGRCGYVTLSNWMFLTAFELLRKRMLREGVTLIADFGRGAFSQGSHLITTSACLLTPGYPGKASVFRLFERTGPLTSTQLDRIASALLLQVGHYEIEPRSFEAIEGEPLVYWWSKEFLRRYSEAPTLGKVAEPRQGLASSDNDRFLLRPWELGELSLAFEAIDQERWAPPAAAQWVPFVKGAAGRAWIEPLTDAIRWKRGGLEVRLLAEHLYGSYTRTIKNEAYYFRAGVAFSMIGAGFTARAHRFHSVIADMGSSVYGLPACELTCLMNSTVAKEILAGLNPTVRFQVGDVKRLPCLPIADSGAILNTLTDAFAVHEAARETSIEFKRPGASPWRAAQEWAQIAVDRDEGVPLTPYCAVLDPPDPESLISFAVGVALGRFREEGEGAPREATQTALPAGILFVSVDQKDSLASVHCTGIREAWQKHGAAIGKGEDVGSYLRSEFFAFHKRAYESRPIHFPLSSRNRNFVALVSIHRWSNDTLNVLLADHIMPARKRLEGELADLRAAKVAEQNRAQRARAERRFTEVQKLQEELSKFAALVIEIAERGPPPVDDRGSSREVDARFMMDLDDGVMVNSAALWPLLEPQWKDPKKWWKQLASAEGKKNYDWSHLAARYFPTRVQKRCREDPSMAVAHGCFWELHAAKAYAWELRLQDEIKSDFTIDEPSSEASRKKFLADHADEAKALLVAEVKRRERKATKAADQADLFDESTGDEVEEESDD